MELAQLTDGAFADSVAVSLREDHYQQFYKLAGTKCRLDSRYGLCFRLALYYLLSEVLKRKYRKGIPPLHIVMESGYPNYGDAERIFVEVKDEMSEDGYGFLGAITKAGKDESSGLMIADFVAHSTFLMQSDAIRGVRPFPEPDSAIKTRGIMHLDSTPEGLANMRAHVMARLQKEKAKKRPAWGAESLLLDGGWRGNGSDDK
jgi:hypothetical protein